MRRKPMATSFKTSLSASAKRALARNNVIYLDRSLIVINKPHGLITQGTKDVKKNVGTIQKVLDELQNALQQKEPLRTVHRLDKNTTGALVIARNHRVIKEIHQQFATGTAAKTYYALVHDSALRGRSAERLANTGSGLGGEISDSLEIDETGRVSVVHEAAQKIEEFLPSVKLKNARSTWEKVASSEREKVSLLRLGLETGVKHQLRVHLSSSLKCPIVGDTFYGSDEHKMNQQVAALQNYLFLHSHRISLIRYSRKADSKKSRFKLDIVAPLPSQWISTCNEIGIPLSKLDIEGGVFLDGEQEASSSIQLADLLGGEWMMDS